MLKRRKKSPEEIERNKQKTQKRNNFFLKIWNSRPHYCLNCKKWLGKEPLSYMFDHLLEKSKYPQFEFLEENIGLVCLICHASKTDGHPGEEHKKMIETLKTKYNL